MVSFFEKKKNRHGKGRLHL